MRLPTFLLAAIALALLPACGPAAPEAHQATPDRFQAERRYPPLVFASEAYLDCSISSTRNGRQIMTTTSGQGFTFDAVMLPIKDSAVKLQGEGMMYRFDAFPSGAIPARFSGLGEGTIVEMKAEVEVDVKRFRQPGGPGTEIAFDAADINADAAYVEFTGLWVRTKDSKRFPFRVLFGRVKDGKGQVVPAGPQPSTQIQSKMVILGTPKNPSTVTTSLYEAEDDVRPLGKP